VSDLRLITFRVGPEIFVLDIMAIRQILPYAGTTSVPSVPSFIEGIIILRNEVVPLIDLRERFGVESADRSAKPLVLVTETGSGPIGLKVDEVLRIATIPSEALLPAPPVIRGVRGDLLIAIIPQGEQVFMLIDIDSILTTEEKSQLQSVDLSSSVSAGTSER
jgi:purine-binding chemotaxis protein CheW